jgi:predicted nuclease with RNAse H fold
MVGRDILQPARVSKKNFSCQPFPVLPSLVNAALPPKFFFMQRIAQDAAEVAKLQEVTQLKAVAIMARSRTAEAEGMAWEKDTLLATSHDEVARVTQWVSVLGSQPAIVRQAKDAVEGKILSLTSEVATTN